MKPSRPPLKPRDTLFGLSAVVGLGALCAFALVGNPRDAVAQTGAKIVRPIPGPPVIVDPPIWPGPPRRPWPPMPPISLPELGRELKLVKVNAQVQVQGGVARTQLTQTFRNTASNTVEGTYLFPLPTDSATSGFAMTQNGRRLESETLDADHARQTYEDIVRRLRDPGLLEWADRGVLRARIFPIPAGGEAQVELSYSQALRADGDTFRYTLPLRLPLGGAPDQAVIDVRLNDADARNVYSPTHPIDTKRDGNTWHASGEFTDGTDRPFALLWRRGGDRVSTSLVTYKPAGEDGYFLLLAAPDPSAAEREIAAKDVVFVADTSGSMNGPKIEQTRNALKTLLGTLRPNDRFNIVAFASDVNPFRPALVAATPENLDAARAFSEGLHAVGSTNISDALTEAFKDLHDSGGRPSQVVFMTDGQPTVGETNPDRLAHDADTKRPDGARVFTFGVGYDVNARLLDQLAEDGHGASDYVLPQEDIEAKVGSLYAKIAYPVLTGARLDWTGAEIYDQYPRRLPDIFRGSQVAVFGRFKGDGTPLVRLAGTLAGAGAETHFASVGPAPADADTGDAVARLWATRKIGTMLDEARREGTPLPDDTRKDLIALARRFGVVTPLTSSLITEDEAQPMAGAGGGIPGWNPRFGHGPVVTDRFRQQMGGRGGGFGGGAADVQEQARAAMPAPMASAGQAAVEASRATSSLRRADSLPVTPPGDAGGANAQTRYAAGKTFTLSNGVWTDADYDATRFPNPRTVQFGTPEYWQLAHDTRVAKWLALGERVLFVFNNEAVRIDP